MARLVFTVLAAAIAVAPAGGAPGAAARRQGGTLPDVLKNSFAYYATLTSYADVGTLQYDSGAAVTEMTAKFTTYFRRPTRDFYFEYQALPAYQRARRVVLWMFKGEMQTYYFETKEHQIVSDEGAAQVRAVAAANYATNGASLLIPSLLYSKAQLPSALLQIEEAQVAGVESIDGRRCHKVVGVAAAYYPSGARTGVRPVIVWIDAETQLIRRIVEDTPKGAAAGVVMRYTFTFTPQANPTLDNGRFQFKVPGQ